MTNLDKFLICVVGSLLMIPVIWLVMEALDRPIASINDMGECVSWSNGGNETGCPDNWQHIKHFEIRVK